MQKRCKSFLAAVLSVSFLHSVMFGAFPAGAADASRSGGQTVVLQDAAGIAASETTDSAAETTAPAETSTSAAATETTAAATAPDTILTAETTTTETTATETTTTETTTTETTTTETTTTTAPVVLPVPELTAEFEPGIPTGDTVMYVKLLEHTGVQAIGISVVLPEVLSADADESGTCMLMFSDAFDEENTFTYYNAESHTLSLVCAGMDASSEETEVCRIPLHIAEEAEWGKEYPVKLLLSSLALSDGRTFTDIESQVQFVPEESAVRTLSETAIAKNEAGESVQLSLSPAPPEGSCRWESSNPEAVSVTEDGLITFLKEGYADITVTCEKRSYVCSVVIRFNRSLNCETIEAKDNGDTFQLALEPAPDVPVQWESSDTAVLSIDENGLAAAHRNGTVTVRVFSDSFEYVFPVSVVIPREISESTCRLTERGKQHRLSVLPAPPDEIQWSSDHPEIASVFSDGTVIPLKNGKTVIRAVCEQIEYTCEVTVKFTYALNFTDVAFKNAGEGVALALLPKDDEMPAVHWQSSDPEIASVDGEGNVTVLKKGEAVIYCVADGVTYTCHVTLLPYLRGDVDSSTVIDITDAQLTLQYYTDSLAMKKGALRAHQLLAADVDENGIVDLDDATMILAYFTENLAQKEPTWEDIIFQMTGQS